MADYQPADLDALCTAGEVVWVGAGSLGAGDGRVRLLFRDQVGLLAPVAADPPDDPTALALLDHLRTGGASFWPDLVAAAAQAGAPYDDEVVLAALWDLVWAGLVTNDSLAPVRALGQGRRRAGSGPGPVGGGGPVPAVSPASAHPRLPAGGRWSRPCVAVGPPTPRWPRPGPPSCSTATASSPGRPLWGRGPRAVSPACTRC